jgi:hypothetical protein
MPHTPATGVIEVIKQEFGIIHLRYRRNGEAEMRDELTIPRSDAEYMIAHGFWTDPDEVKDKPSITLDSTDVLKADILDALNRLYESLQNLVDRYDPDSIRTVYDQTCRDWWVSFLKGEKG